MTPDQGHDHDHEHGLPHRRHHQAPDRESGPEAPDHATTLGNRGVEGVLTSTSVQRSGATAHQELDEAVARSIESRRGGGAPLAADTRDEMEGALGTDLGDVRVHTDGQADELNRAVSAKAFTAGDDVFFRSGTYDPGSSSGKELLAHELTHVVQQRSGTSGLEAGQVSDPGDAAEQEASSVGSEVASAAPARATEAAAPALARQEDEELEDPLQATVARQEDEELEEPLQAAVARQEDEELEEPLQAAVARQEDEELEEPLQAAVARQEDEELEDPLQAAVARQEMAEEELEEGGG